MIFSKQLSTMMLIVLVGMMMMIAAALAHAPEDKIPGVVDLDSSNVNTVLDGSRNVLVEFYAPWCGHCKTLAPEMFKVGESLVKAKKDDVVQVAKVNCDAHKDICAKYEVRGYPTIKFIPKGSNEAQDYNKGRTHEDILSFLNEKTGAAIRVDKPVSFVSDLTPSNFDAVALDSDKDVLVEFYAPWCGHCKKLVPEYEKVASAFRLEKNVVVAKVDADAHRELGQKFGVTGFPTIKFFPRGSAKSAVEYTAGRSAEDFINFLNEKAGTKRTISGDLNEDAGRVGELDELVAKFKTASAEEQKTLIEKAEANKDAPYYARVMKRIAEKGAEYVAQEKARLNRVLESGSVNDARLDDMRTRINILTAFE